MRCGVVLFVGVVVVHAVWGGEVLCGRIGQLYHVPVEVLLVVAGHGRVHGVSFWL